MTLWNLFLFVVSLLMLVLSFLMLTSLFYAGDFCGGMSFITLSVVWLILSVQFYGELLKEER